MPFEGLWIASDEMNAPDDPVMGPGATTLRLARATGVRPGESVLDVGCGAGTLALVAASRGASRAVGVDLMERAVQWSRFNARLNELEATFKAGDLTEPVAGERFELVISQPPFVIQAGDSKTTTYLHGGQTGDELTLRLISELSDVLSEEGRAIVLFDAPRLPGSPLDERLNGAMSDAPLQLHAVSAKGHSADQQSIAYTSVRHPDLGESYINAVRESREHLEALGIEGSDHVLLHARRAPEDEEQRTVVLETDALRRWDHVMLDELVASASVATRSDARLMTCTVQLPPGAALLQESTFEQPPKHRLTLHFESGRATDFELSDAAAVVVEAASNGATIERLVANFAEVAGAPPDDVAPQVLAFVRKALLLGLVTPG
jgi:SAM-dependent methyltransferase